MADANLLMVAGVATVMAFISGASAATCGPILTCPNLATNIYSDVTDQGRFSWCCKNNLGMDYCCTWQDAFANKFGIDPNQLAIPVGALIGIVVGAIVLMLLFLVCCCWCCGICCFRGRKRTVTTHHTVAFAPPSASHQVVSHGQSTKSTKFHPEAPPYNPDYNLPARR